MPRQNIDEVTFTFDIVKAFLHVPVAESYVVDPPQELLAEWVGNVGDPDVCYEF